MIKFLCKIINVLGGQRDIDDREVGEINFYKLFRPNLICGAWNIFLKSKNYKL